MLGAPQLPLQDPAEDQPADDHHVEDQLPHVGLTKEPQIPVSTAPAVIPLLPTLPASSAPPVPPAHSNSAGPSTSAPPPQHSSISPSRFPSYYGCSPPFFNHVNIFCGCPYCLSREDGTHQGHRFSDHNHARLEQRHPRADTKSPGPTSVPAQASPAHPLSTHPAPPAVPLDILVAAATVDTPSVSSKTPQPTQVEDDTPLAAHP